MSPGLVLNLLAALGVLLAPLGVTAATAQQPVARQLTGRVQATVVVAVSALADSAATRGLPVEPLVEKAIEGGAKAATPGRIVAAVQAVLARLGRAQGALQAAGVATPAPDAIEAGGFALSAGLEVGNVQAVALACGTRYSAAVALRVAGTLSALGVPPAQTVELVKQTLRSGAQERDLLALPGRVEAQVAQGATPAQAAAGLARAAAARAAAPGQNRVPPRGQSSSHRP